MEKIDNLVFGMHHLNISQLPGGDFSHKNQAVDVTGEDTGIDFYFNRMKNTWLKCTGSFGNRSTGNTRFYMTCDSNGNPKKVRCADNVCRVVTLALTHSGKDYPLYKMYGFGEEIYREGTSGYATGNHIHLEIAEGNQVTKSYDNGMQLYRMRNELNPVKMLFIDEEYTTIVNTKGVEMAKCKGSTANGIAIINGKARLFFDGEIVENTGEAYLGSKWYMINDDGTVVFNCETTLPDGRIVRYDMDGQMVKGLYVFKENGKAKACYYDLVDGHKVDSLPPIKAEPNSKTLETLVTIA